MLRVARDTFALLPVRECVEQWLAANVWPRYRGPLGIDLMVDAQRHVFVAEINVRHTMGMVAAALGQRHAMRGRFVIAPPTTPHRLALTPTSARQAALLV